jgi:2-polyprenyl-6-methoxyphenol hydroxylase-like FAD-dependent oxidoreductase
MPQLDRDSKVLIIGAGPGGLAFGQILRNHGVEFEIFERDSTLNDRNQGWAVALLEWVALQLVLQVC